MNEEHKEENEQILDPAMKTEPIDEAIKRRPAVSRKWSIIMAVVIILAALAVCVGIYNRPENRLARQLDLGERYLEEQNYAEAVLAFGKAIEIDDKCIKAYKGQISSYIGLGDKKKLEAVYEAALAVVEDFEPAEIENDVDAIISIYLAADEVYSDNMEKTCEILEKGYEQTGDPQVEKELENSYAKQQKEEFERKLEEARRYKEEEDYEKSLKVYDELMETEDNNLQSEMDECLQAYMDELLKEKKYDEVKALAEKYKRSESGIDFETVLDEIREQEEITAWVDDLYTKMTAGDFEAVCAIIKDPGFTNKCKEVGQNHYFGEMSLITSEGKEIVVGTGFTDSDYGWVAYCPHVAPGEYWNFIYEGDYAYHVYNGGKECIIGNEYYIDGREPDFSIYGLCFET